MGKAQAVKRGGAAREGQGQGRRGKQIPRSARNDKGSLVLPRWGRAMLYSYTDGEDKTNPRAARLRRRALQRQERPISNNVGSVKSFLSVLLHALRRVVLFVSWTFSLTTTARS
jgi:hypothetical protein